MTKDINDGKEKNFPATVVSIINENRIVINKGAKHGLKNGQRLLVYKMSKQEIIDPNNGESLGYLEIVKGTGKVIHIQEKMSTIESDKKQVRRIVRSPNLNLYGFGSETVESEDQLVPFEEPEVGDLAKPI
jgi:hypothetical protein